MTPRLGLQHQPTSIDTSIKDTSIKDTSIKDTSIKDTSIEDTSIYDTIKIVNKERREGER